jgi:hypothetical protein
VSLGYTKAISGKGRRLDQPNDGDLSGVQAFRSNAGSPAKSLAY